MNEVKFCKKKFVIVSFQLKDFEVVEKKFFRLIELAVVNSMIIFHEINPDLGHTYTSH